jgi:hypothetical protein
MTRQLQQQLRKHLPLEAMIEHIQMQRVCVRRGFDRDGLRLPERHAAAPVKQVGNSPGEFACHRSPDD